MEAILFLVISSKSSNILCRRKYAEYSRTKQNDATSKQCVHLYEKSIKLIKLPLYGEYLETKGIEKHHVIETSLDKTTNHMNCNKPSRK